MIVGGWGIPESVMITSTLHPLPLACDLDVAPALAHLILCPAAEVGQLRVAQLLDGQPVGVALPAVDVSLVMTHLLLVTPGQVIPGDLCQCVKQLVSAMLSGHTHHGLGVSPHAAAQLSGHPLPGVHAEAQGPHLGQI